jgi:flagellar M-ring protein FliF
MTPPQTNNSSSETQKQNETVNYEVSKSIKRVVEPVGRIKRLSAAVLVDGSYKDGTFVPRSDAEMKRYQMLVKTAIGFDGERGDQVEVINVPFDGTPTAEPEETGQIQRLDPIWVDMSKRVGLPMLAFIVLILFLRGLLKHLGTIQSELRLPHEWPKTIAELEAEIPVMATEALPDRDKLREIDRAKVAVKAKTIAELQDRVVDLARRNPAKAAAIAREWIREP